MFTKNVAFGILYITDMSCISDTIFTEIITTDTFLKDLPTDFRLHRLSNGLSYLLKVTKKNRHTSTGLLTAHLEAWKLVPALMQVMFGIGHDGVILPGNDKDGACGNFSLEWVNPYYRMLVGWFCLRLLLF